MCVTVVSLMLCSAAMGVSFHSVVSLFQWGFLGTSCQWIFNPIKKTTTKKTSCLLVKYLKQTWRCILTSEHGSNGLFNPMSAVAGLAWWWHVVNSGVLTWNADLRPLAEWSWKMFLKPILKAALVFKLSHRSPVSNSVPACRAIWPRKKSTQPFGRWPPADPSLKPVHQ